MYMTLSMTSPDEDTPATDLGYLLHKHPDSLQQVDLSFGQAHIFYPEATAERCTMVLLLDIDPIALSRQSASHSTPHKLWPYVNDRPYVCSSFMSVAISRALGTALGGRCKTHEVLAHTPLPLTITLGALPVHSAQSEVLLRSLFEPLGYALTCHLPDLLDPRFPSWGPSHLADVTLTASHLTLRDVLEHLYVLIPVLDNHKHYYVGHDEVEKLMRRGERWLAEHPARELIARRYLKRRGKLVHAVLDQLTAHDEDSTKEDVPPPHDDATQEPAQLPLHARRLDHVLGRVLRLPHQRVLDLGCGEGKMLQRLLGERSVGHVRGVDVSSQVLERAARRLKVELMSPERRARLTLSHGSAHYCDPELKGFDVVLLIEVIEHIEAERLGFVMHNVLGVAKPAHLIITTPNADYNVLFESLTAGAMRHADHRFEWGRAEFERWATTHAERHGYTVTFEPVGDVHEPLGAQTQMATFSQAVCEMPSPTSYTSSSHTRTSP